MDAQNLYFIYRVHPHGDSDLHHQLIGKFVLTPDHFEVLEDHNGALEKLARKKPAEVAAYIHKLSSSMYYKLVSLKELQNGEYPELIRQYEGPPTMGPESSFEYHRVGMPDAQVLEFHNGKAYIDGHALEDQDLQMMLDNVQQGHASLSYRPSQEETMQKAEAEYMALAKVESGLEQALASLREAVKAGHVDPKHLKAITGEIFTDSMAKGVGNKKAYADFLSRPKQGVHIRMDGANFGDINKKYGFETGNQAIVSMFGAVREAMDESVGRAHGKVFRIGGDEGHLFVPTHEHAALFARALRGKLEKIPAIGGTHPLAMSLGFGHTPDHAELAMINAKSKAKEDPGYRTGQVKTHAASQVPGFEGHIPLGPDQLHLKPLPSPEEIVRTVPHILPPGVSAPEKPKPQSTGAKGPPASPSSAQG